MRIWRFLYANAADEEHPLRRENRINQKRVRYVPGMMTAYSNDAVIMPGTYRHPFFVKGISPIRFTPLKVYFRMLKANFTPLKVYFTNSVYPHDFRIDPESGDSYMLMQRMKNIRCDGTIIPGTADLLDIYDEADLHSHWLLHKDANAYSRMNFSL